MTDISLIDRLLKSQDLRVWSAVMTMRATTAMNRGFCELRALAPAS